VLQVCGLTETFGHVVECLWRGAWDDLPATERAAIKACQDVTEEGRVVDVVTRKPVAGDDEIIAHCRYHLVGFKMPRHVAFGDLPKTATGKIQKFLLRRQIYDH